MDFKKIKINNKLKSRKAQGEVFGMSFGMIFTIILIVFFIVIAIIFLKALLGWQKCTQIGTYLQNVQTKIDKDAYNSRSYLNPKYVEPLPTSVAYACFVNMSAEPTASATATEKSIYEYIKKEGYNFEDNLYLFSEQPSGCPKWTKVKHVDLTERNPICFKVINGKTTMKIERKSSDTAVKVSI